MEEQLNLLIERYPKLGVCKEDIRKAYELLEAAYQKGRKLLVCGNGGSASDSEHIVGELMKEFKLKRKVFSKQAEALKKIDSELGQTLAEHLQGALPAARLPAFPAHPHLPWQYPQYTDIQKQPAFPRSSCLPPRSLR